MRKVRCDATNCTYNNAPYAYTTGSCIKEEIYIRERTPVMVNGVEFEHISCSNFEWADKGTDYYTKENTNDET